MLLAALTNSPAHVCARYRLRAFQPALAAAGHRLDIHGIPDGWWGHKTAGAGLRGADALILQRRLFSPFEVSLLRRRARRLWFEIDDAVWRRDSYTAKGLESRKLQTRFRAVVQAADLVIAGNRFLAANAIASGARRTVVIPTCVDVHRYPSAAHDRPGADLVWVGSSSTLRGLEAVTDLLEEIGTHVPGARLKLICDRFLKLARLPVVETPWAEATEGADIAAGDVGLSWIPDDTWSRGKCGLKVLQYMAAGLPVVANPVGVHPEMIRHGVTGFLATTPAEWVAAVRTLAADPDLRRRMGAAGRRVVEERYSVEVGAAHWRKLCEEFSSGGPLAPRARGQAVPGGFTGPPPAQASRRAERVGHTWTLTPAGRTLLAAADLDIAAHLRAGRAETVKHGDHRTVYRVTLPRGVVYWKYCRLNGPRARWREIIRGPKAKLEFDRLRALAGRGIATIEPLAWAALGWSRAGGSVLLTRALDGAVPLDDYLNAAGPTSPAARRRLTHALAAFLNQLHAAGVSHPDLHPGNILIRDPDTDPTFFLIDVHDVGVGPPLSPRARRANLVLLNRWFQIRSSRADRLRFWRAYAGSGDDATARRIEGETDRSNVRLWANRNERCVKDNRSFWRVRGPGVAGFAVRELDPAAVAPFLADPDAPFARPGAKILKASRSSTVCELDVPTPDGPRPMVYKRFRITKASDPVVNLLRPSPARRSWTTGHTLLDRALPTPPPWLVLHRYRWGCPAEGYLLCEKVEGADPLDVAVAKADGRARRGLLDGLAGSLRAMHDRGVCHRDLKAANLLVGPDGGITFIDLVGVRTRRHVPFPIRVRDLTRLNASFLTTPHVSLGDRLRFLRTYLRWGLRGPDGWKAWWTGIAGRTAAKVRKNLRRNRPLA